MKKNEFLIKLKIENLMSRVYAYEFDTITDAPFVMGCVYEGDSWKIFKTTERTGHYIIKEFFDEDSAFNYFYELCLLEKQVVSISLCNLQGTCHVPFYLDQ